jgi:hypothetical protein
MKTLIANIVKTRCLTLKKKLHFRAGYLHIAFVLLFALMKTCAENQLNALNIKKNNEWTGCMGILEPGSGHVWQAFAALGERRSATSSSSLEIM